MAKKPAKKSAKSTAADSDVAEFSKDEELRAYRDMLLIRRFEEKAGQLYGMGLHWRFLSPLYRSGSGRCWYADGT